MGPHLLVLPRRLVMLVPRYATARSLSVLATRRRLAGSVCSGLVALCLLRLAADGRDTASHTDLNVRAATASLTGGFEANRGQADRRVLFLARNRGFGLLVAPEGLVVALPATRHRAASGMRIRMTGSSAVAHVRAGDPLPQRTEYRWGALAETAVVVRTYGLVSYEDLYPGIALRLLADGEALVLSFDVDRGAEPAAVRLEFEGAQPEPRSPQEVALPHRGVMLRLNDLVAYQGSGLDRRPVSAAFVSRGNGAAIGFEVGTYDVRERLVIESRLGCEQDPSNAFVGTIAENGLGRGE